jgi:hypothetical protein
VHKWEDNVEMELKQVRWKGVNCIDLSQDRD